MALLELTYLCFPEMKLCAQMTLWLTDILAFVYSFTICVRVSFPVTATRHVDNSNYQGLTVPGYSAWWWRSHSRRSLSKGKKQRVSAQFTFSTYKASDLSSVLPTIKEGLSTSTSVIKALTHKQATLPPGDSNLSSSHATLTTIVCTILGTKNPQSPPFVESVVRWQNQTISMNYSTVTGMRSKVLA